MLPVRHVTKKQREIKKELWRFSFWRLSSKVRASFILVLFSSIVSLTPSLCYASASQSDLPTRVCFGEQCLSVEVADTDDERSRGLQNRSSLPEGQGMLFIFPSESTYRFWMKETFITLDMVWLDSQRRVVGIATDVPPCKEDPCPQYGPSVESLYVLEANAGYALRLGLKIGDRAVFK